MLSTSIVIPRSIQMHVTAASIPPTPNCNKETISDAHIKLSSKDFVCSTFISVLFAPVTMKNKSSCEQVLKIANRFKVPLTIGRYELANFFGGSAERWRWWWGVWELAYSFEKINGREKKGGRRIQERYSRLQPVFMIATATKSMMRAFLRNSMNSPTRPSCETRVWHEGFQKVSHG